MTSGSNDIFFTNTHICMHTCREHTQTILCKHLDLSSSPSLSGCYTHTHTHTHTLHHENIYLLVCLYLSSCLNLQSPGALSLSLVSLSPAVYTHTSYYVTPHHTTHTPGLLLGADVRDPELRKGRSPRELMLLPAALASPPALLLAPSFLSRPFSLLPPSLSPERTETGESLDTSRWPQRRGWWEFRHFRVARVNWDWWEFKTPQGGHREQIWVRV